jgi:hypothetical protein
MNAEPQWNSKDEAFGILGDDTAAVDRSSVGSANPITLKNAVGVATIASKGFVRGVGIVSDFATNNSWGMRTLSFCVSLSFLPLSILGLLDMVGQNTSGRPGSFYLFNSYMVLLSALAFVAECKDEWPVIKVCCTPSSPPCYYCLDCTTLDARTVRLPQVQPRPWGLLHFYWYNLVQCMGDVMGSAGSRLHRTRCSLRCFRLEGPSGRPVRFAGAIWGSVS